MTISIGTAALVLGITFILYFLFTDFIGGWYR